MAIPVSVLLEIFSGSNSKTSLDYTDDGHLKSSVTIICKGGVAVIKAVKILALPRRGGGSDPCQDLFGGFDIVNWGQPKVIMDPQK